jgi:hypothetical protein
MKGMKGMEGMIGLRLLALGFCVALIACGDREPRPPGGPPDDSTLPSGDTAAAANVVQPARTTGTYEFVYPHNTPDLIENHYIVLEDAGRSTRGWYYGTSDDFDPVREGYLPGFFVAEMLGLNVMGDSIRFTLAVPRDWYFTKPVPLNYRSAADVPVDQFEKWQGPRTTERREYQGTIARDRIALTMDRDVRVFSRTDR